MTPELEIRPYRSDDESRLLEIWRTASAKAHPFFTSSQLDRQEQLVADVYLPKAETWVAALNGAPAGFIGLIDTFMGGLFVDPDLHGRGVGRALVDHARKLKGQLELEVYALNNHALTFYERLRFQRIGERPTDDNGLPLALIRLRG